MNHLRATSSGGQCGIYIHLLVCCILFIFIGGMQQQNKNDQAANSLEGERPNILFLIMDDWSYPHASIYGDDVVKTPTFDRVAREGILFDHAFVAVSSCTPSRASILTGQAIHRLEAGANLFSFLPRKFPNAVSMLEDDGYLVGHSGKGWGPGNYEKGGYARNPAGPEYSNYSEFLDKAANTDRPFFYWHGGHDPHRPYKTGSGRASGMDIEDVELPGYLPDVPVIKSDLLDYYYEVQRFDSVAGDILNRLEELGELDNTLVVYTSDNGMPFPRAKSTAYDGGTRVPLAISWRDQLEGGRQTSAFISFTDFAPTFLEIAGIDIPDQMTGWSFLQVLTGTMDPQKYQPDPEWLLAHNPREEVFIEKERHVPARVGGKGYPVRAIRTKDYLYIRNLKPDRWPAGDPIFVHNVGPYGDLESSPSKTYLMANQNNPEIAPFIKLTFHKKPAEELYDLARDPDQLHNVASDPEYEIPLKTLRRKLNNWRWETADPRYLNEDYDAFEKYPYYLRAFRN